MKEYILIHVEFKDKEKSYRQFDVTDKQLQKIKTQLANPSADLVVTIKHRTGTAHFELSEILQARYIGAPIYI